MSEFSELAEYLSFLESCGCISLSRVNNFDISWLVWFDLTAIYFTISKYILIYSLSYMTALPFHFEFYYREHKESGNDKFQMV